ncbi:unannotated protein [freshwater metagenome]|uniref:Unannotated protein n=1 Tax=freshwater metagenome TaxID=449393 RepID=A0A6J7PCM0_9ZZZZ
MAQALGEVPVRNNGVDVVIANIFTKATAKRLLGNCHTHTVCKTLSEWPCGDLNTCRVMYLGVTRGGRSPLAELSQIF